MNINQLKFVLVTLVVMDVFLIVCMFLNMLSGFVIVGDRMSSFNLVWIAFIFSMAGTIFAGMKFGRESGKINFRF
ncbi:MAG: hypothetical protein OHK0017_01510 [Patescibacteria group bacterium]